ncbi:MAG: asparagine synthase (glutamine-hydrolyzing) [Candidatus Daviesbacteria bacterium]|nr:asparagine synthase (glutamine-hydrolyzing) [Candidatus Daviesbacteria bacterium]
MCGITGYVNLKSDIDKKNLYNMLSQIRYRGPDDQGTYFDKYAALGIQRLSIIDLKGGHQPICNEDKSIWVIFNGEIYNYRQLRQQLIRQKHIFKTKTDTEVIIHLYEQYGESFPKLLNGMFAFAIWDKNKHQLILARDPAGIKPLYFYQRGDELIFGSELKTILKYPKIIRKINLKALELYKYLGYIPTPYSIFQNIYKLDPGTTLIFSIQGIQKIKFWGLDVRFSPSNINLNLDHLLENTIRIQSRADVPVGIFLSGGIDSSLIAYYLSRIKNRRLKTFSISFAEKDFDEAKYFNQVANVLNTEHFTESFNVSDVLNLFPQITSKLDEPLADPSIFPTYKLCQFAAQNVKVVLSGDGGDELFAGYPTYPAHILANIVEKLPEQALKALIKILHKMPVSFKNYPLSENLALFLAGLKLPLYQRHLVWMSIDKSFPQNDWYNSLSFLLSKVSTNWQTRLQILDFLTYLTDDLLVKVDRASMYNSLEVRVPFLDPSIIEFAYLTNQKHFNAFSTKISLRNLLKGKLPDEIVKRGKKGFGIPLAAWIWGPLNDLTYDHLKNSDLFDYFDKKMVWKSFKDHKDKRANLSKRLWTLVIFSSWLKNWKVSN